MQSPPLPENTVAIRSAHFFAKCPVCQGGWEDVPHRGLRRVCDLSKHPGLGESAYTFFPDDTSSQGFEGSISGVRTSLTIASEEERAMTTNTATQSNTGLADKDTILPSGVPTFRENAINDPEYIRSSEKWCQTFGERVVSSYPDSLTLNLNQSMALVVGHKGFDNIVRK